MLGLSCTDVHTGSMDESDARALTEGPDAAPDAGSDRDARPTESDLEDGSQEAPAGDTSQQEVCSTYAARIAAFVADHSACQSDDDCAIVGDCSHSDFQSVAKPFEAEAQKLVLENPCQFNDGPTYYPVCRAGKCERQRSVVWCGSAPQTQCPLNTKYYRAGCGSVAPTFSEGCHAACSAAMEGTQCAPGYTCQRTWIDPCGLPGGGFNGEGTCAACGSEQSLCLPAPTCEVQLAITFDGRSFREVLPGEATRLELWFENRTDQQLRFSFDMPCLGPRVEGLTDYDLWSGCLAGACQAETVSTEVTLAPREKRKWRSALVVNGPSECNAQGLGAGDYTTSFALVNVQGASACGSEAAALRVMGRPR